MRNRKFNLSNHSLTIPHKFNPNDALIIVWKCKKCGERHRTSLKNGLYPHGDGDYDLFCQKRSPEEIKDLLLYHQFDDYINGSTLPNNLLDIINKLYPDKN